MSKIILIIMPMLLHNKLYQIIVLYFMLQA